MSRLIDLTAPLGHPDLCEVPTFPPVEYWRFHEHATHGRQNSAVRMAIHQGTHLDAPSHFFPDGANIDEMPLETFCGRAVKIDLRETVQEAGPITREMIEASPSFEPGRLDGAIAVTWTGWAKEKLFTPGYFATNPYLDTEACHFLCDCGMKALCMDHGIDPGMQDDFVAHHEDSPGHRAVLGRGVPLIEHVINLETFEETEFEMFAFPVKLYRIEGAPARVVARLD
jgi:kynurenine formamidase